MPKLWSETIQAHREEVGDAILDTTAALVAEQGLRSVTMSQIAKQIGIGRATLYRYYPDVEAILVAWHERQVTAQMDRLAQLRDSADDPGQALETILEACARTMHERGGHAGRTDLSGFRRRDQHHTHDDQHQPRHHDKRHASGDQRLQRFLRDLLAEAARAGYVRADVAPDELAAFCIHALEAAHSAPSKPAVQRLVDVTLAGLRPDD